MENYLLQNSKLRNMLKQLCRDTPISGYGYVRFAKDNPTTSTHIYSTNNDWTEYKLKQKFTIVCPSTVHYGKIWQYKMVPRLGDKLHERCMDAGEKFFQIYHPIDIIHNVAGNIEVHAFAVNKPGTDAVNCYLNEMELLQYFAGISSIFMHEQLELDKPKPQLLTENQVPVTYTSKLDIMERIVALHLNKSPSFSKSEKKVIYAMFNGLTTVKQLAKYLGLSPRTIEDHLENIKNKIGVWNKADIVPYFKGLRGID